DGYRVNIPADHPLNLQGGALSGPPPDADCLLILDMLVPWPMHLYRPGGNVRIITLAIDPIHRMTPIYEFPTDLAIGGDAGASLPLLLEEVRAAMNSERRGQCGQRSEARSRRRIGRSCVARATGRGCSATRRSSPGRRNFTRRRSCSSSRTTAAIRRAQHSFCVAIPRATRPKPRMSRGAGSTHART